MLEAFANKSVMETLFREGGYIPPVPSVIKNADEEMAGVMLRFKDTLAVAGRNTVPWPVTAVWPEESPLISNEIHAAYTGDKTPSRAMSDLVGKLEDVEDPRTATETPPPTNPKLTPEDGGAKDRFGVVGLSGDGTTAVIGAFNDGDPNGEWAGSAYAFSLEE